MNPKFYYHTPTKPVSTRASCPVCHQTVYSRAGIHPQCAVIQSDPPRLRSKKPHETPLLNPSIGAIDLPGADVAVEPTLVELVPAVEPPIIPRAAKGGRLGTQRLGGPGKGTWAGFIR
jgi:hypothetical protein